MIETSILDVKIDMEKHLAMVRFEGICGVANIRAAVKKVVSQAGFRRNMNSLIDFRKASIEFAVGNLKELSDVFLQHQIKRGHGFRIALLVDNDLTFGLSRMIAVELEQVPIYARVYKKYSDAVEWVATDVNRLTDSESA